MMLRLLCILVALSVPAFAQQAGEQVIANMSTNRVAITANFDGSEILIFGAVKRETPPPDSGPLEVIIAISGPSEDALVRQKSREFGIWINSDSFLVEQVPSFYAVASSNPLHHILNETDDLEHGISVGNAVRTVSEEAATRKAFNFTKALIRIREASGLYSLHEGSVEISEETLFNTSVSLPSNLTEGIYVARIFLVRDSKVVSDYKTLLFVQKEGLERWIFNLAQEQPLIYGLLSLFIAISAGWGASAIFRVFRP